MPHREKHFRKSTRRSYLVKTRHINIEDAPDTNVDYASNVPGQRGYQYPLIATGNIPAGGTAEGRWYYDATTHLPKYDNGTDLITFAVGAAGSLNTSYDAGAIINVDAGGGDLELDLADSSTDKNVQIKNIVAGTIATALLIDTENASASCILDKAIEIKTSGAGSTIGVALDVSDGGITTGIDIGATKIDGTYFNVSATGATVAVGLDYGAGSLVGTGDIDIGSGSEFTVTAATGNTAIAGTLDVTGTSALAGAVTVDSIVGETTKALAIAAANAQALTLDADTTGTITIGGTSTGNITLGQSGVTSLITLNATSVAFSGGFTFGGTVVASNGIQLNGALISFDTDDDSGLVSPSDNQIDIELDSAAEYGFELARLDMNNNDLEECGHITFSECDSFPAGTEVFIGREDDGDLRLNCLTGKEVEIATADTVMATFNSNTLAFKQASTITTSTTTLTLTPTTDVVVSDGKGLIVGNGAQMVQFSDDETASYTAELQVQGTAVDDTSIAIVRGSADAFGGVLSFAKGRDALGTYTTVVNSGDNLGSIIWYGADTSDMRSLAASIKVEVDATAAANDMPGRMVFSTTADGAIAVTEAMRIDNAQDVRCSAGLIVGSTDKQATTAQANEFQVLGTAAADSSMTLGQWNTGATGPALDFVKSGDAVIIDGSFAIVSDNDDLGALNWYADDGTTIDTPAAQILCEVDGTPGANDMPARLVFSTTADAGNTVTEAMRLSQDQSALFAGVMGLKATAVDANTALKAVYVETDPSDTAKYGMYVDLQLSETSDATPTTISKAIMSKITLEAATDKNMSGALAAVQAEYVVEGGATGTYATMSAFRTDANVGAGTLTAGHGLFVNNATVGGTLTNQYGIRIADLTSGGTTNYGIYIDGASTEAIHVAADPVVFKGGVYGSDTSTEHLVLKGNTAAADGAIETEDRMRGLHIGGAKARGWPTADNYIYIEDSHTTAPAGAPASAAGCGFYSSGGEMFVIDAGGNALQFSPHDTEGYYYFRSKMTGPGEGHNVHGRVLTIHWEKFIKAVIKKWPEFSEFVEETIDPTL